MSVELQKPQVRAVWDTKPLAELCEVFTDGNWIETKDQSPNGIRLVQTGNVGCGDFKSRKEKARYISEETFSALKCTEVIEGDCLISRLPDPVGRSCIIPDTGEKMITAVDCTIVRFRGDSVVPEFFNYFSQSRQYLTAIDSFCTGATRRRISRKNLGKAPIPVPPLPEQERIVAILEEAFEGIATATAHAERNLHNARELFQSVLQSTFEQKGEDWVGEHQESRREASKEKFTLGVRAVAEEGGSTKTGGRNATTRHIPGPLSLAVGLPQSETKRGWKWHKLADLARLESGHTPSRKHPEYWGGDIPWIGIKDARIHHGDRINETLTNTNDLGIENSSARILPKDTVCLSRTASVGYVFVMGRPMATSQDFVNWICSEQLDHNFLKYIFLAEGREGLLRYASGSVHQTIYYPEAKAFHVCCPSVSEQKTIVQKLDSLAAETRRLEAVYQRKLDALAELKQSLLQRAFAGEL